MLIYATLPIVPGLLFTFDIRRCAVTTQQVNSELANTWFAMTVIYTAFAVPAAFFRRRRLFRGYAKGRLWPPKNDLLGM